MAVAPLTVVRRTEQDFGEAHEVGIGQRPDAQRALDLSAQRVGLRPQGRSGRG